MTGDFKNCSICRKVFQVSEHYTRTCEDCLALRADEFKAIEELLTTEPLLSALDVAQRLKVPISVVMSYVEGERIVPEGHGFIAGEAWRARTKRAEQLPIKLERSGMKSVQDARNGI